MEREGERLVLNVAQIDRRLTELERSRRWLHRQVTRRSAPQRRIAQSSFYAMLRTPPLVTVPAWLPPLIASILGIPSSEVITHPHPDWAAETDGFVPPS